MALEPTTLRAGQRDEAVLFSDTHTEPVPAIGAHLAYPDYVYTVCGPSAHLRAIYPHGFENQLDSGV